VRSSACSVVTLYRNRQNLNSQASRKVFFGIGFSPLRPFDRLRDRDCVSFQQSKWSTEFRKNFSNRWSDFWMVRSSRTMTRVCYWEQLNLQAVFIVSKIEKRDFHFCVNNKVRWLLWPIRNFNHIRLMLGEISVCNSWLRRINLTGYLSPKSMRA
jgi:hypothetical protein